MIYLADDTKKKLEYMDKIFSGLSLEELKTLAEREEIVAKLKAEPNVQGPITQALYAISTMNSQAQTMQVEIQQLKGEIGVLVKAMCSPHTQGDNYEFRNLKNRFGIYN